MNQHVYHNRHLSDSDVRTDVRDKIVPRIPLGPMCPIDGTDFRGERIGG